MEEKKREKLPVDARLLSDAVIELNISRRSVGLYPKEHPITRESIQKAFEFLRRLFELRSSITIGIAKDTLVVDEHTLDRRNPVFREFALNLHGKGIAAVTFSAGLTMDELLSLHELITEKAVPVGKAFEETAVKRGLIHIRITPLDISKFGFIENSLREDGSETQVWEDYICGLLEGRLSDSEAEGIILAIPPEAVAEVIHEQMPKDAPEISYDRVITSYLRQNKESGFKRELFSRFVSMVQNLSPAMKQQFLKRAFSSHIEPGEAGKLFNELTRDDIEKMMKLFNEHASLVPEGLRNIVDKLSGAKRDSGFFDLLMGEKAIVDDVEIDEEITKLFSEDKFKTFVAEGYQAELERVLEGVEARKSPLLEEIKKECRSEIVDRFMSEVVIELLEEESTSREEYLSFLTEIAGMVNNFLETGRFYEIADIYNTLYAHALAGRFREEASGMLEYSFYSGESLAKFINAFKVWGRHNREGVARLAGVLKRRLTDPLLDALAEETDPAIRKFLLSVLSGFKTDVLAEAVRRLSDERWYVVRNMIYLIRECGGVKYLYQIRPFAKHEDKRIGMEAVKTLIHFNFPGAFSYIRFYLQSKDMELRDQVIRLIGAYKIKEAVPYLIEILEKKDLFGTGLYYKVSVVRALGEIGDPRALDALMRLYNSSTLIHRGVLEELRAEIFRSLSNYPPATVKPLLARGITSKNSEIRVISEKLLKNSGNDNGQSETL